MAPSLLFGITARDVEPQDLNRVPLVGMIVSIILAVSSIAIISSFLSKPDLPGKNQHGNSAPLLKGITVTQLKDHWR